MSGINTIRKLTETDLARIEAAARRFAARHGIKLTEPGYVEYDMEEEIPTGNGDETTTETTHYKVWCAPTAAEEVESAVTPGYGDRPDGRARLWQAAFCRALGFRPCADLTIGWGYVGTRCK